MSSSAPSSHSSAMPGLPSQRSLHPEILLDKNCRIGSCENLTSAKTGNRDGLSVEVSFKICDPPALSLCFVRCDDVAGSQPLAGDPEILSEAGGLVLLAIPFSDGGGVRQLYVDFFVYRAGPGIPSLHLLPMPYPTDLQLRNVAVLPICDDSEHYAVVFPDLRFYTLVTHNHYTLDIYRSDSKAWCYQVELVAEDTETQNTIMKPLHDATSVVYAGSGFIGWVDLWWGVLLCNVLDEKPTIRFVEVPAPLPCKTLRELYLEYEYRDPRIDRHLTIYNGVMKFIELKYHADAAFNPKRRDDQGWMATIWTRPISSDVWHEGLTFDTSDLSVTDSSFLHLLPDILVEEKKLVWKNFACGAPTLSLYDDDIVYILANMDSKHQTTFVLSVNTRSLTLESCAQCFGESMTWFDPTYVPSVLSSYYGVTTCVLP